MTSRTDTIIRALWEATDCGKHTIRKYRVADITGSALTPEEDAALLDTGIVREIPGMGGPSSYAFTVTTDDLHAYSVGEFWAPEIEDAAAILTAGDEFPDVDHALASDVTVYGAGSQ